MYLQKVISKKKSYASASGSAPVPKFLGSATLICGVSYQKSVCEDMAVEQEARSTQSWFTYFKKEYMNVL
jgi:hypothetical protein